MGVTAENVCNIILCKSIDNLSGIKIPGYPTDGKIWHLAHLLKPHHRGPGKTDSLKALTACQSLEAENQPPSRVEPCRKVSGEIYVSGDGFRLARAPVMSSKRLTPAPCRERLPPRLTPATKAQERPTPLAYFCLARGTRRALWQNREPRGPSPRHPLPPMGQA
jgi:hypothetical protein